GSAACAAAARSAARPETVVAIVYPRRAWRRRGLWNVAPPTACRHAAERGALKPAVPGPPAHAGKSHGCDGDAGGRDGPAACGSDARDGAGLGAAAGATSAVHAAAVAGGAAVV